MVGMLGDIVPALLCVISGKTNRMPFQGTRYTRNFYPKLNFLVS